MISHKPMLEPMKPRTGSRGRTSLTAAAVTDRGVLRQSNEDRTLVLFGPAGTADSEWALLAVADGVGGAPAGEVASMIAVETLAERFDQLPNGDPSELLTDLFVSANQRICDAGDRSPQRRGMACTLVAALVRDGGMWLASVGDSRAYLRRGSSLVQLTTDHSLASDNSLAPELRRLAAARPGARNILTRSLGNSTGVTPDVQGPINLGPGDWVLLCSDGLYNLLSADELGEALEASGEDVKGVARTLVALANERGAPDNVSVVILKVGDGMPAQGEA